MSKLVITVDAPTPDTRQRAVDALLDAGLQVAKVHDGGMHRGLKWASVVLWVAVVGLLLAWIWVGDWRFGLTAGVGVVAGFTTLGLSMSRGQE